MGTREQNENVNEKVRRNKGHYKTNKGVAVIKWLDEKKEAVSVQVAIAFA